MKARVLFVILLLFSAAIPVVFTYGPALETRLQPVVTVKVLNLKADLIEIKDTKIPVIFFSLEAFKHRPCQLNAFSFSWHFDHSVLATPVIVADTGVVFQAPVITSPGHYSTPMLYTEIPVAAYGLREAYLRGVLYYNCHALWPISQDFIVRIALQNQETQLIEQQQVNP